MQTVKKGKLSANAAPLNSSGASLNEATSSAHATVDSVIEAADEAVRSAKPAIKRVAAFAHQAVDKAADAAAPTTDWLSAKGNTLDATQKKMVADASSYVSSHLLKAAGFALVAGILLSRIVR